LKEAILAVDKPGAVRQVSPILGDNRWYATLISINRYVSTYVVVNNNAVNLRQTPA
jgi:hypothetical protein